MLFIVNNLQWSGSKKGLQEEYNDETNVSGSPDQGIHFLCLNIIHLFDCILYLLFVSTNVNNEKQSIVIFNLLHGRLSSEGILENLIMIELIPWWSTDATVLGVPVLLQCLRRWNVTDVQIFLAFFLKVGPDFTAFAAFKACAFGSAFLYHLHRMQTNLMFNICTPQFYPYFKLTEFEEIPNALILDEINYLEIIDNNIMTSHVTSQANTSALLITT